MSSVRSRPISRYTLNSGNKQLAHASPVETTPPTPVSSKVTPDSISRARLSLADRLATVGGAPIKPLNISPVKPSAPVSTRKRARDEDRDDYSVQTRVVKKSTFNYSSAPSSAPQVKPPSKATTEPVQPSPLQQRHSSRHQPSKPSTSDVHDEFEFPSTPTKPSEPAPKPQKVRVKVSSRKSKVVAAPAPETPAPSTQSINQSTTKSSPAPSCDVDSDDELLVNVTASKSQSKSSKSQSSERQSLSVKSAKKSSARKLMQDGGHDDICNVCNDGGDLIVCAYCVHVYHFDCLEQTSAKCAEDLPDDWECAHAEFECTQRATPVKEDFIDSNQVAEIHGRGRPKGTTGIPKSAKSTRRSTAAQPMEIDQPVSSSNDRDRRQSRRMSKVEPESLDQSINQSTEHSEADFVPRDLNDCDDYCAICNHAGNVLSCSRCVNSYHFLCLGNSKWREVSEVPDSWQCSDVRRRCEKRTAPRKVDSELTEEEKNSFKWIGKVRKANNLRYYSSGFERAGDRFVPGSMALIQREGQERDDLIEILECYEDIHRSKYLLARFYMWPEQTANGRLSSHLEAECFPTAHSEEIPLESIQRPALVLNDVDYSKRAAAGELDEDVFCARVAYNDVNNQFRPIIADDKSDTNMFAPITQSSSDAATCDSVELASTSLQLSSLPPRLPCREKEHCTITSFLTRSIRTGGAAGSLFIAGVPGTGKTASVRQSINELRTRITNDRDLIDSDSAVVPPFTFIELNGMKMPNPNHCYSALYRSLTGKHASPSRACALLDQRFKGRAHSARPVCVLLIDEIDWVMTRSQSLLYQLSDWPTHSNARLILIAISNTINFPHLLQSRVQSRFNGQQLFFAPYNKEQIIEIVKARLSEAGDCFAESAIAMCAAKVAAVSGDVRRALSICRRAIEIQQSVEAKKQAKLLETSDETKLNKSETVQSNNQLTVSMASIHRAMQEMVGTPQIEFAKHCRTFEVLILSVLALHSESRGNEDMDYQQMVDSCLRLQAQHSIKPEANEFQIESVAEQLYQVRLIQLKRQNGIPITVRLSSLTRDDLAYAFEHHAVGREIIPQRL